MPTMPNPGQTSRAQPRAEANQLASRPYSTEGEQSQPQRVERNLTSKGLSLHTVVESSGASRAGHPSRLVVHVEKFPLHPVYFRDPTTQPVEGANF